MLGVEFTIADDVRSFYNVYAKQTCFSVRMISYYISLKDISLISQELCCSKEGFCRERSAKKVVLGDEIERRRARPITRKVAKH